MKKKQINYIRLFTALSVLILVVLAVILIVEASIFGWPNDANSLGDSFGLANALFSGLAFAGVIIAILMQRDELGQQKEELALTRNVFVQQRFESSFFQMLTLHHEIVKAMEYAAMEIVDERDTHPEEVQYRGRACFQSVYRNLKGWYDHKSSEDAQRGLEQAFMATYRGTDTLLGHYFRNLYTMVSFVDESGIHDKRTYTNIVRAQLSSYELTLLFYNCAVGIGKKKFGPLVEKYGLLKNVPTELLLDSGHISFFKPSAFQGRIESDDSGETIG